MKSVIITPAYSHAHQALQQRILESGIPWLPAYRHSDLPRARSFLIEEGLKTGAERLIFVDADTIPGEGVLGQLARTSLITESNALWGLYPLKEGDRWSVCPVVAADAEVGIAHGLSFEIQNGGLGLAAVHRESLLRVADTLPTVVEDNGFEWRPFCMPFVEKSRWYADDKSLCARLAATGTQLICDPTLRAGHAVTQIISSLNGT